MRFAGAICVAGDARQAVSAAMKNCRRRPQNRSLMAMVSGHWWQRTTSWLVMGVRRVGAVVPAGPAHRSRSSTAPGTRRVHRPWVTEPGLWLQYGEAQITEA